MKATLTASELLFQCDAARGELSRSFEAIAPRHTKWLNKYIESRLFWFGRTADYWAAKWPTSGDYRLTKQCSGWDWTQQILDTVERLTKYCENLPSETECVLTDEELAAISYVHWED